MFLFLVWQSMQQFVRNQNQDHFNNSAQKAIRIHNMFPRFLIRIGPDRAYPLHFTLSQLLLELLQ